MTEVVTQVLAVLTVVGQLGILLIVIELVRTKGELDKSLVLRLVDRSPVMYSFFVASIAMLGSLFFSEIAHYEPCKFCWLQRIAMYPLVVLFGLALVRRESSILPYGFALSLIGAVLAFYHYLMQTGVVEATTCSAVGVGVSCSDSFTMSFGYISIPMMALTAFGLITMFTLIGKNRE